MKPLSLMGHWRPLTQVLFNSTGELLFSAAKDGHVCGWNVEDGSLLMRYKFTIDDKVIEKVVWDIDVTEDGSQLLAATAEGIFIVDVETGEQLHHISLNSVCKSAKWNKKPTEQVSFVAAREPFMSFVKAGIVIYSLNPETNAFEKTQEIIDFTSKCLGVAWGPFDETIFSRHEDGTVIVWDAKTGKQVFKRNAHAKPVTDMDFSADRTLCLTCGSDGTAKLWTTHNLEEVQTYTTDRPLNGCSISPLFNKEDDSRRMHILVAGGQSASEVTTTKTQEGKQEAILMHMVKGDILGLISGHFSPINAIAFMPNGKGFATGAEEGNVRIYRFDPIYFEPTKFN